jgi:hypothetical protein
VSQCVSVSAKDGGYRYVDREFKSGNSGALPAFNGLRVGKQRNAEVVAYQQTDRSIVTLDTA